VSEEASEAPNMTMSLLYKQAMRISYSKILSPSMREEGSKRKENPAARKGARRKRKEKAKPK